MADRFARRILVFLAPALLDPFETRVPQEPFALAAVGPQDIQSHVGRHARQPAAQAGIIGRRGFLTIEAQEDLLRSVFRRFLRAEQAPQDPEDTPVVAQEERLEADRARATRDHLPALSGEAVCERIATHASRYPRLLSRRLAIGPSRPYTH